MGRFDNRRKWSNRKWLIDLKVGVPLMVAFGVGVYGVVSLGSLKSKEVGGSKIVAAGFTGIRVGDAVKRAKSSQPRHSVIDQMRLRTPTAASFSEMGETGLREITIAKTSPSISNLDFGQPREKWKFLTRDLRREIDESEPEFGRWDGIQVHGSGGARGSAKVLGYYHRTVRGYEDGLAYHFVIGNGSETGAGEIEIGDRWVKQIAGELRESGDCENGVDICLVGDFERDQVSRSQLEALDELLDYLKAKVGDVRVDMHGGRAGAKRSCLGPNFPRGIFSQIEESGGRL